MSQMIRCHACQAAFPLDPEALHSYRDGLIQGQRLPRYWIRCPDCKQKNVIELTSVSKVIAGKPSAR
jgi:phage FluMu protein Com